MYPPGQDGSFGAPTQSQGSVWGPTQGNYEFNEQENQVIAKLATTTKINGIIQALSFGAAVVTLLAILSRAGNSGMAAAQAGGGLIGLAIAGFFSFFVMISMFRSSAALQRVVDTQGNDIGNLIEALAHQRSFFGMMKWLMVAAIGLVALACVAGMLFAGSLGT
ncbi:MAG: hypothetical protein JNK05_38390 [Myxococcales bacterium]|nr:hypothetical protein [Myxococcales bacterium]